MLLDNDRVDLGVLGCNKEDNIEVATGPCLPPCILWGGYEGMRGSCGLRIYWHCPNKTYGSGSKIFIVRIF